eukprot:scaffold151051_cov55-Attheya_sp.AAC.1
MCSPSAFPHPSFEKCLFGDPMANCPGRPRFLRLLQLFHSSRDRNPPPPPPPLPPPPPKQQENPAQPTKRSEQQALRGLLRTTRFRLRPPSLLQQQGRKR